MSLCRFLLSYRFLTIKTSLLPRIYKQEIHLSIPLEKCNQTRVFSSIDEMVHTISLSSQIQWTNSWWKWQICRVYNYKCESVTWMSSDWGPSERDRIYWTRVLVVSEERFQEYNVISRGSGSNEGNRRESSEDDPE